MTYRQKWDEVQVLIDASIREMDEEKKRVRVKRVSEWTEVIEQVLIGERFRDINSWTLAQRLVTKLGLEKYTAPEDMATKIYLAMTGWLLMEFRPFRKMSGKQREILMAAMREIPLRYLRGED